jgi:hypothetical protein
MKKILIAVAALSLASSALAAGTVGVEFGSNWYKVSYTDNVGIHLTGQGQNFLVFWGLENDLQLGAYTEADTMSNGSGSSYSFEVFAIQIAKGIIKNVYAGLNVGQMTNNWSSDSGTLVDVFGSVILLSGGGEKVSGTVKATVAGRFSSDNSNYNWNGMLINLSVGLGF